MQEIFSENKFKKILDYLGIKKKDKLLVNSNTLNLMIKHKDKTLPNKILDILIERITPEGTLLFPTYNWDFCNGSRYDSLKTRSTAGTLSNLSLKNKNFVRSKNPIYSFSVFGKDKNKIANLSHYSCFGLDSPFGYLIKNKGKNLFIDLDYKDALTFVHVAEESAGVNYRYHKIFTGKYTNKNRIKKIENFEMYVRKKDKASATFIDKKFDNKLLKKKALKKIKNNNSIFSVVDVRTAYNLMYEDIKHNKGLIRPIL
jgi:aminoglycoside 3-N-acetyltransferase